MAQKIITQEIRKQLPELYGQESIKDPTVFMKLFTPWAGWTWLVTEASYDSEGKGPYDYTMFGFAYDAGYPEGAELGYLSLKELMDVKGPVGLRVERDMYFKPCLLSEAKQRLHGLRRLEHTCHNMESPRL